MRKSTSPSENCNVFLSQPGSELVALAIELTIVQNMHIAYQATIDDSSVVELLQ